MLSDILRNVGFVDINKTVPLMKEIRSVFYRLGTPAKQKGSSR